MMESDVRPPSQARSEFDGLDAVRTHLRQERAREWSLWEAAEARVQLAPRVDKALQALSDQMFSRVVGVIEEKLTIALQEVLGQPIALKAKVGMKYGAPSVEFCIERDGNEENILKGQGGSVANVLSVGLRLFALVTLDPSEHRPFLVLDEQDCWLRPDLVPALVRIVRQACGELGFQVLMISHHDYRLFEEDADRIYRIAPNPDGSAKLELVSEKTA